MVTRTTTKRGAKVAMWAATASLLLGGVRTLAQTAATVPATLPARDQAEARAIFKQLIETNTEDSDGSVTAAANAMRERLLQAGFPAADLVMAGPNDRKQNLVARFRANPGATKKPVLFICHLDVVEARKRDWTTDPFQFVEKDGYFYGRGTEDVKSGDAALVDSLIRLRREGFVPQRDIVIALTADEEGGAFNGVDWLLTHRPELMAAEFVINPDAGQVDLRNGRAVQMGVEATEKLYADYRVSASNRGGHSSEPRPDNAIYELAHALERLEVSPFPVELNAVSRAMLEQKATAETPERAAEIRAVLARPGDAAAVRAFSHDPADAALLRTTCVATMLQGGHAPNALPGEAWANVNCRILPGHSQEEVRQRLITVMADPALKIEYMDAAGKLFPTGSPKKSMEAPPVRDDVFAPLRRVADQMWPGIAIVPTMNAGASDSVYTMAAGIPSYGISGMAFDPGDDRAHGRDERIGVNSFFDGVEFQYRLMKALGTER